MDIAAPHNSMPPAPTHMHMLDFLLSVGQLVLPAA